MNSEASAGVVPFVQEHLVADDELHADEHASYGVLGAWYDLRRVNHQEEYSGSEHENINQAESFFSRFRRCHYGQVHRLSFKYLHRYVSEMAYREDWRRRPNGEVVNDILYRCLNRPPSPDFHNYLRRGMTEDSSIGFAA